VTNHQSVNVSLRSCAHSADEVNFVSANPENAGWLKDYCRLMLFVSLESSKVLAKTGFEETNLRLR
jgi:hypothetical protein